MVATYVIESCFDTLKLGVICWLIVRSIQAIAPEIDNIIYSIKMSDEERG